MKKLFLIVTGLLIFTATYGQQNQKNVKGEQDPRIEILIKKMTLDEKLGQLNQFSNPYQSTGTGAAIETNKNYDQMVREGKISSFLNILGAEETMRLQKIAVEESRLGIPLLFGYDVIHGFKTIFPIPLADAASFDRSAMEKAARVAAIESAASGLNWTFAPMMDIARDPRWGRIMEGSGEDVYLGAQAAIARVKGFQGDDLSDDNTIAACAKHFAGYGAPYGGREYHMVDMSERMMREVYLPPFKAAVDAGVATMMSAFNTNSGVPASGDRWLQTDILRGEWGFRGFVLSDWTSVAELTYHAVAENPKEAGFLGLNAGVDMDMMGSLYIDYGKELIAEGKITEAQIDEMVRRVLHVKFKLGLFDKPYQYSNAEKQKQLTLHPDHLAASRDVAKRSIVLMKNKNNLLPLSKNLKKIAVIGPLAKDKDAPLGNWRGNATPNSAVSLFEGLQNAVGKNTELIYAEGTKLTKNESHAFFTHIEYNTTDRSGFKKAIAAAKKADVVVLAIGETAYMSGECRSYANIELKGLQMELLKEISKTGKPVIITLFTGRPLVLTDVVDHADAILNCWQLGSEAGNAIADVLFGDYNPSAKLPASFPYHTGQIPIFYEQLPTGRPFKDVKNDFSSKYRDIPNEPLFSFGYGLSYTEFKFSDLVINHQEMNMNETLTIKATVTNTGKYDGEEVVQLYIRDLVGKGVSRPMLQMKGFEKVFLKKGESKVVQFKLTPEDLSFFRLDHTWGPEPGMFEVFVGNASDNLPLKAKFELK